MVLQPRLGRARLPTEVAHGAESTLELNIGAEAPGDEQPLSHREHTQHCESGEATPEGFSRQRPTQHRTREQQTSRQHAGNRIARPHNSSRPTTATHSGLDPRDPGPSNVTELHDAGLRFRWSSTDTNAKCPTMPATPANTKVPPAPPGYDSSRWQCCSCSTATAVSIALTHQPDWALAFALAVQTTMLRYVELALPGTRSALTDRCGHRMEHRNLGHTHNVQTRIRETDLDQLAADLTRLD